MDLMFDFNASNIWRWDIQFYNGGYNSIEVEAIWSPIAIRIYLLAWLYIRSVLKLSSIFSDIHMITWLVDFGNFIWFLLGIDASRAKSLCSDRSSHTCPDVWDRLYKYVCDHSISMEDSYPQILTENTVTWRLNLDILIAASRTLCTSSRFHSVIYR